MICRKSPPKLVLPKTTSTLSSDTAIDESSFSCVKGPQNALNYSAFYVFDKKEPYCNPAVTPKGATALALEEMPPFSDLPVTAPPAGRILLNRFFELITCLKS